MKYQSEIINQIIEEKGHYTSQPHYESECIESWVEANKNAYPKLTDYQSEWLNYANEHPIGMFPYKSITDATEATVENTVPYAYKSAILTGNTLVNLVSRADKSYFGSLGAITPTFNTSSNFISTIMTYPANNTDKKGAVCFKITRFLQYAYNTDLIGLKGKTFTLLATIENGTNSNINIILSENGYNTTNGYTITTISSKTSQNIKTTFTVGVTNLILGHNTILASSPEYCSMSNIVIVEGEFTNQDIPYFEGMQSVKTPVLTTSNEDGTKTNILTVNEDVELGSVGEVKDELNLLTGQLTQRTETRAYQEGDESNSEVITDMTNTRYKLPKEVIKTVDLTITNQDGEPCVLKPIEGKMCLSTDGETIKPTFTGEIPIEAITQNLASFIEE